MVFDFDAKIEGIKEKIEKKKEEKDKKNAPKPL
jgi:hypothetical protein